jgi:predicted dithiol-disulfide oxidoreductase (DUF899 family)
MYAKAFEDLNFDSKCHRCSFIWEKTTGTLLSQNKHTIMLVLTSNEGAFYFRLY